MMEPAEAAQWERLCAYLRLCADDESIDPSDRPTRKAADLALRFAHRHWDIADLPPDSVTPHDGGLVFEYRIGPITMTVEFTDSAIEYTRFSDGKLVLSATYDPNRAAEEGGFMLPEEGRGLGRPVLMHPDGVPNP